MDLFTHDLPGLFAQLGLPSGADAINGFIATHRPLADATRLADAGFWTPAQAQFLREEITEDADWAPVIDQLNVMLRM